jgi:hypothetical protein
MSDDEQTYCVLLADIVRSRRRSDAAAVQATLERVAGELGQAFESELASALTVTSGDELQALLFRPTRAFDLAYELTDRLHPLRVRFGVGRGELTTPLRPSTGSLSGPAFYVARDAIDATRRAGRHIQFEGFGDRTETFSVVADCAIALVAGWTPAQRESVRAWLSAGSHQAAADQLGRERSTITRNLQRALAPEVQRVRELLRDLLDRYVPDTTPAGATW